MQDQKPDKWEPTPKEYLVENLSFVETSPVYGYFFQGKKGKLLKHNLDGTSLVHFPKYGVFSFQTNLLRLCPMKK